MIFFFDSWKKLDDIFPSIPLKKFAIVLPMSTSLCVILADARVKHTSPSAIYFVCWIGYCLPSLICAVVSRDYKNRATSSNWVMHFNIIFSVFFLSYHSNICNWNWFMYILECKFWMSYVYHMVSSAQLVFQSVIYICDGHCFSCYFMEVIIDAL